MMRSFLVSSLVCSALVLGCGDDKPGNTGNSQSGPTSDPSGDSNSESGAPVTGDNETGQQDTGSNPTTNVSSDPMTSGDPSGTSEPGTTFIVPTDMTTGMIECDVFAQDCMDGFKCSAYAGNGGNSWDSAKCVPVVEDPKQPGDACTVEGNGVSGIDDCDLGAYCWDTSAENIGTCVALCKGTPEAPNCEDTEKTCAIYNDGVLNLCLDRCDPLAQNCPMSDDVCIGNPSDDGFLCVLDASGEEGQQHDACEYANSCDPGLICLNSNAAMECDPASSGCCEPFCDLSDPNADMNCMGAGQVCNPYYEMGTAPPGEENVGFCAIPM